MTYKSVLARVIEDEARAWVEEVLQENGIKASRLYTEDAVVKKEDGNIYWDVKVIVQLENGSRRTVIAGGTACDMFGISKSVIWDSEKNIIWMSVAKSRKQLGIEKLRLGA